MRNRVGGLRQWAAGFEIGAGSAEAAGARDGGDGGAVGRVVVAEWVGGYGAAFLLRA